MVGAASLQSVVFTDVDSAIELGGQLFYKYRVEPAPTEQLFVSDLSVGRIGALNACLLGYGAEVTVSADAAVIDDAYAVHIPRGGALEMSARHADLVVDSSSALITGPAADAHLTWHADDADELFVLKFDQHFLEIEIARILGRDMRTPIAFENSFSLQSGPGSSWYLLARTVAEALKSPDDLVWNPLVSAQLSSTIMTGFLLATDNRLRDELDARPQPAHPALIRRAVAIIDERADEPLTVSGIAAEVGSSVRALQAGFQKHLGTTPGRQIARVRMDRVHYELVTENPATASVSEIASRWGFAHLSRFASAYRGTYGILPSETLRRG
jgi:AraC-like DNA-binding protein